MPSRFYNYVYWDPTEGFLTGLEGSDHVSDLTWVLDPRLATRCNGTHAFTTLDHEFKSRGLYPNGRVVTMDLAVAVFLDLIGLSCTCGCKPPVWPDPLAVLEKFTEGLQINAKAKKE